jgi:hypothetical protein
MRALVARLSRELGREIELVTVPRTVLKMLALFVPFLREIDEMLYQWEELFEINDTGFRARFGLGPEDVNRAAADTVAWAKIHYGSDTTEHLGSYEEHCVFKERNRPIFPPVVRIIPS